MAYPLAFFHEALPEIVATLGSILESISNELLDGGLRGGQSLDEVHKSNPRLCRHLHQHIFCSKRVCDKWMTSNASILEKEMVVWRRLSGEFSYVHHTNQKNWWNRTHTKRENAQNASQKNDTNEN